MKAVNMEITTLSNNGEVIGSSKTGNLDEVLGLLSNDKCKKVSIIHGNPKGCIAMAYIFSLAGIVSFDKTTADLQDAHILGLYPDKLTAINSPTLIGFLYAISIARVVAGNWNHSVIDNKEDALARCKKHVSNRDFITLLHGKGSTKTRLPITATDSKTVKGVFLAIGSAKEQF